MTQQVTSLLEQLIFNDYNQDITFGLSCIMEYIRKNRSRSDYDRQLVEISF